MTNQPRPRVLLVDDDSAILRVLEVNFSLEGFDVETASQGEEALEKAAATRPAIIVLDAMMPGMDGWEVCRRLREDPSLAEVPVVFLSARPREDARDADKLGVVRYVTKPFDPVALVEIVRRHAVRGEAPL
jgi:CheY-like chemotaxis protein